MVQSPKLEPVILQLFENSLLAEGDLPEPASMVPRINQILEMFITEKDDVKRIEPKIKEQEIPEREKEEEPREKNGETMEAVEVNEQKEASNKEFNKDGKLILDVDLDDD